MIALKPDVHVIVQSDRSYIYITSICIYYLQILNKVDKHNLVCFVIYISQLLETLGSEFRILMHYDFFRINNHRFCRSHSYSELFFAIVSPWKKKLKNIESQLHKYALCQVLCAKVRLKTDGQHTFRKDHLRFQFR